MKASEIIISFLVAKGIKYIFGYPGGNITHLLDSIYKSEKIKYIQGYHEQACAFAAEGYARASNGIGVALSSSGPGATNLITGIADAYFDSVPCVFITGQVNTNSLKKSQNLRQNSFQETDIVSIVKPITKYAETVKDGKDILYCLEKAFYYALNGRKGPILLDLPHNIQASEIEQRTLQHFNPLDNESCDFQRAYSLDDEKVWKVYKIINSSERPVILIGSGATNSEENELVLKLSNTLDMPIVSSLMGLDTIDNCEENFMGFIGASGMSSANTAVKKCDMLLVLGSRLEGQHIGNPDGFAKNAKIIHVDIDIYELINFERSEIKINTSIKEFLFKLLPLVDNLKSNIRKQWIDYLIHLKKDNKITFLNTNGHYVEPNLFLRYLNLMLGEDAVICADVGQNLLWTAQELNFNMRKRFLASGGLGAMGFALPASIGSYYARPDSLIVCIAGDGGIQMNLQEFQTIVKYNIPIKIFILNNNSLGMIREYQEKWFEHRLGSVLGYLPTPDFAKLAYAFGLQYKLIDDVEKIWELREELNNRMPYIFEVLVSENSKVF